MASPIHVSTAEFNERVLESELPVIVDFWADWCAPCRQVAPVLDELAQTYDGRVVIAKVNVDNELDLARDYEIRSIPTFVFFRDGQVVGRVSGALPRAQFAQHVDALVEADAA